MTCYFSCVLGHVFLSIYFSFVYLIFIYICMYNCLGLCLGVLQLRFVSVLWLLYRKFIVYLNHVFRFLSGKVNYYFNQLLLYNCDVLTACFSFKKGLTKNVFYVTTVKKMDVIFLGQSGYPKLTSFLVALMLLPFIGIMENWCCCRWWNKLCVSGNHLE